MDAAEALTEMIRVRDEQEMQRAYLDATIAAVNSGLGTVMLLATENAVAPLRALGQSINQSITRKDERSAYVRNY